MTERPPQGDAEAALRLEKARAVYATIFTALQASVQRLEAGEDNATESRARLELYRSHVRQLQTVFELEGSLDTFGRAAGAARLDLDAARAEIRERLARISEHGGGGGVP